MDLQTFKTSLDQDAPPKGVDLALQSLWYEAKGDWDEAHRLAQAKEDTVGSWVHAYLHRQEGDLPNANYWYSRAGRKMPAQTLAEEWDDIASTLLAR